MTTRTAVVAVAVVLAWAAGRAMAPTPPIGPPRVDTVPPAALLAQVRELELEADGLRARLAGIERRPPRVVIRTDTVVTPPDTVLEVVAVDGRGRLSAGVLLGIDSLPGMRVPELWRDVDVSDCDDGLSVGPAGVICDRARLGHLWADLAVEGWPDGGVGLAGLRWRPSHRSSWSVGAWWGTDGRWRVRFGRGVEVF